ncbi:MULTISPECIES: 3-keto-5-aminohexanoate cleavage protein [Cupriavidus]|uniref:3-keto-5-aminohexanoate cleavage protein n=1 Tax=Cupriavidus oxalaticus TaxID=96344 RepID=A0A4P7LE52_9BURK|nr:MULTISPECIES: 3-keto-5-aminohexanoate cleavage protein [Cupriavidus]MBF6987952.1 3-keto-5-aminohexanoate cleavage protein [Cupriavidus sp. IK-TO18]QBY50051.1 3-keto-5-aminohexanoate cleavage protein [Cupriavidus oxalaticus]
MTQANPSASTQAAAARAALADSPLIVTVAPNGAYKQAADHPAVPLTAAALAQEARACLDAGAAMMHMHVRDAQGRHSLDAQAYRDALAAVKQAVGDSLLVQVTSEAAGVYKAPAQMAMVRELRPEAVSVGLREVAVPEIPESELAAFFAWLARERVMTQVILYDAADVRRWHALRARGLVPAGAWSLLYVLGRYSAGQVSSPHDLLPFLQVAAESDDALPWAICAFGREENACVTAAAAFGGHVRVGFENNLLLRDGSRAPGNAALVAQAVQGGLTLGRPIADAADARRIYGAVR